MYLIETLILKEVSDMRHGMHRRLAEYSIVLIYRIFHKKSHCQFLPRKLCHRELILKRYARNIESDSREKLKFNEKCFGGEYIFNTMP